MQSNQFPSNVKSIPFDDMVWNIVVSDPEKSLIIEQRNETNKSVKLIELDLLSLESKELKTSLSWWEKVIGVKDKYVYTIKYQDRDDPSKYTYQQIDLVSGQIGNINGTPAIESSIVEPNLYEHGTEYYLTVSKFLSITLPLSCEYLEWEDKIIISYYLRSTKGFDRFLLALKDGQKEWKICQDREMKGFAAGAFFVVNNKLIFVKDRNELCIYTM